MYISRTFRANEHRVPGMSHRFYRLPRLRKMRNIAICVACASFTISNGTDKMSACLGMGALQRSPRRDPASRGRRCPDLVSG